MKSILKSNELKKKKKKKKFMKEKVQINREEQLKMKRKNPSVRHMKKMTIYNKKKEMSK